MNEDVPPQIPVRKGGESRSVMVRLVHLDGVEVWQRGRTVRYAGSTHVMVAVNSPTEYLWMRVQDVAVDG